jgi:hypothetical protein
MVDSNNVTRGVDRAESASESLSQHDTCISDTKTYVQDFAAQKPKNR